MDNQINATEVVLKAIGEVKEGQKNMAVKADIDALKTEVKADVKTVSDEIEKVKGDVRVIGEMASKMNVKTNQERLNTFTENFGKAVEDAFEGIKALGMGSKEPVKFHMKAAGDMTLVNNAGNTGYIVQDQTLKRRPMPMLNVRELIRTVPSSTGIYRMWREDAGEGEPAFINPGSQKPQVDTDISNETYVATFLAAFAKFDRSMATDLPWLQSELPGILLRKFYLKENSSFASTIASTAAASLTTTGTTFIEQLIDYVAGLEATAGMEFAANGIVVNPLDWAKILRTKPSDYGVPEAVTITPSGDILVAGVPLYKAAWVSAGNAYVADWNQIGRMETDGLSVQFFEQDENNVQYNRITARIECREVLVFDRKEGVAYEPIAATSVA